MTKLESLIERALMASRWILVVFYFGLAAGLAVYAAAFLLKLAKLAGGAFSMDENGMILAMLGLIDAALVASLVVMVMLSGYENFVSKLDEGREDISWLGKLSAGTLKVKVASAIVAISSIHLLQVFLNIHSYENARVEQLTWMHLAFVISALVLAVLDKIMDGRPLLKGAPGDKADKAAS
ncbi:MAG: TIGR00645 family protein [Neomegalonema sp.]|nr:TIGR00645 family protein [Neomegalonema sp.]